jgi:hypothetical protein
MLAPTTDSQVREEIISFQTLTAEDKLHMLHLFYNLRDSGADIQEAYIETLRQQIEP